jgi:Holliday junction DNA helicase RuvB
LPRPAARFRDFVGQKQVIAPILRELHGAMSRGEPIPHIASIGPSGVGKSLFIRSLAAECGTQMIKAMGNEAVAEIRKKLVALKTCDFLFIDECHALKPDVQELLFEALDHRKLTAADGTEPTELQPFTLALATDRPGALLNALHKRICTMIHFALYSTKELKEIIELIAKRKDLLLSPHAANQLARVCNGLPRKAEHFLLKLRLFYPDAEHQHLSLPHVEEFLSAFGIDECGLGAQEHCYLRYLEETGSASLETLSLILGTDPNYVLRQIEPALFHLRFVTIRPGGRTLTEKGKEWIAEHDNSKDSNEEN